MIRPTPVFPWSEVAVAGLREGKGETQQCKQVEDPQGERTCRYPNHHHPFLGTLFYEIPNNLLVVFFIFFILFKLFFGKHNRTKVPQGDTQCRCLNNHKTIGVIYK